MNDFIVRASELLSAQIVEGAPAWMFFVVALTLLSAFYLIRAWIYKNRRGWESFNFILLCVPIFICSGCNLLESTAELAELPLQIVNILDFAAYTSMPALICFHIWSQVSYKPITAFTAARYFLIPTVLTASMIVDTVSPHLGIYVFTELNFTWEQLLGGIYLVFMLARCYLLCFNVFYQMPRHMRRSTYYMLIAVSSVALSKTLWIFIPDDAAFILENVALAIAMERFISAFYLANSSKLTFSFYLADW
jgi:hypothetical protein